MKKSGTKWSTLKCSRCGSVHAGYSGKLDAHGVEYVVCGVTHKRMNVSGEGEEGNTWMFSTVWIPEPPPAQLT